MCDAVILIPGIKGNQLLDVNTHNFHPMWRDFRFNFQSVEDLELTDRDTKGGQYEEKMDRLIERGPVESLAYKEFMEDIEVGDTPKFFFSYDWRKSNRYNGKKLHEFIEMLKSKSQASTTTKKIKKVCIVTHSMGNHVLRFYIKDKGFDSIDKVVFVAPPFMGSLAMVSALIEGQGWFRNVKKKLREIVRTFPGAIELLPRYENAAQFKDNSSVDFFDKTHWQKGIVKPTSPSPYLKRLTGKFIKNLEQGKKDLAALDKWMDKLTPANKKRMLVIVRDEYKTDQAMRVYKHKKNEVDLEGALVEKQGDSVVPNASSCVYHKQILTLALEKAFRYDDDRHAFVMTEERVQHLVSWFFESDFNDFNYQIPGNSIKKVTKLESKLDSDTGLSYWKIEKS